MPSGAIKTIAANVKAAEANLCGETPTFTWKYSFNEETGRYYFG